MMQGITSLPGAQQGPQGPMPGQSAPAQVMPQQQGGIAPPITAPLEKLPPQQLLMMYNNPQDMTPKWAVATAYAKAVEQARLMQMAQGQSAMAQGMAQAQEPPVAQQIMSQPIPQETQYAAHGGMMRGYAGGGAVSFDMGGSTLPRLPGETDEEYKARVASMPRQPGESDYQYQRRIYSAESRQRDIPPTGSATPPVSVPRPNTARSPTRPSASVAAADKVLSTPRPDNWADIEKQGLAGIAALQDVLRRQSEVDPELARLRTAAYESAQGIAQRRESDRLAALESAQKTASTPILENQEALLRLAGAIGGKMRFGEALGAVAGTAGTIKGEQRKALETAQRESRAEQNAIDQLNQALAEKRVADRSGDVDRKRTADAKVAEAQLKVTDLRSNIEKERATEADRAEQRRLTERGQNIQQQTALAQLAKPGETLALIEQYRRENPGASFADALKAVRGVKNSGTQETLSILRAMQNGLQTQLKNAPTSLKPAIQAELNRVNKMIEELLGAGAGAGTPTAGAPDSGSGATPTSAPRPPPGFIPDKN